MPTISENVEKWDVEYNWPNRGDEWSAAWGGPAMQWYGTLLPRIQRFVPTDSILEIACGYGRWTQFLHKLCQHLVVIDISEECIQTCKQRFSQFTHVEYHVNDGKSLAMIPDHTMDFVFSFDSLVHADVSVLEAYISQLPRILKHDGAAFFHHSNLGEYARRMALMNRIPGLKRLMVKLGVRDKHHHWRDPGVSAKVVKQLAEMHGLTCRAQEIVHWGTKRAKIDCFTTMVTRSSTYGGDHQIFINNHFMQEAEYLSHLSRLYQNA